MKHNNDFRYDLNLGVIGEKKLAEILQSKKIEVKTDFKAKDTGNVFIEYESRGNPSGISTSEADYWAFILTSIGIVIIEKERLKIVCRRFIGTDRDVRGGDNNTSKGIKLPVSSLVCK